MTNTGRSRLPNDFDDAFQARRDLVVGETQNVETFGRKECITHAVSFLSLCEIVTLTIKFDDDFCGEASKVGDVVLERDLSAEA